MTFCANKSSVQSTNAVSPLSSIHSILLHYSALFNVPLGVLELIFGDVCRQIDEALYNQPLAQLDTDIRFKVHLYRVLEGVLAKTAPLTELLPPAKLYTNGDPIREFTIFCDNYAGIMDIEDDSKHLELSSLDDYLCPVCEKLMLLPVVLHPCGHTICRACLERSTACSVDPLSRSRSLYVTTCSICTAEVAFANYQHELCQKLRNRFTFNCAFFAEGCIYKGLLSDMESHLQICPYALKDQQTNEDTAFAAVKLKDQQLRALEADIDLYSNMLNTLNEQLQSLSEGAHTVSLATRRLADSIPLQAGSPFSAQLARIDQDIHADPFDLKNLATKLQILGDAVHAFISNSAQSTAGPPIADQSGNIAMIHSLESQLSYYKKRLVDTDERLKEVTLQQGPLKQEVEVQRALLEERQQTIDDLTIQLSLARDQLTEAQRSCSCAVVRSCNEELAAENKRMQMSISSLQRMLGDSKQELSTRNDETGAYKERLVKLMMDTNELTNTLVKFQLLTAEQNKRLREMSSQLQLFYSGKPVCYDCGCRIESAVLDPNTIIYTTTELVKQSERTLAEIATTSLGVGTSTISNIDPPNISHLLMRPEPAVPVKQGNEDLHVLTSDHPLSLEHFIEDDINIDITAITLLRYIFHPKMLRSRTKLEHFANDCKGLLRKAIDQNANLSDEERLLALYQLLAGLRQFYANDYPLDEILDFLTRFQLENSLIMRDQFGVEARRSIMEGYKKVRSENRVLKATLEQVQEKKSIYRSVLAEKSRGRRID